MGAWFDGGLRFGCTRCGHCCTGEPGSVRVGAEDLGVLAAQLALSEPDFRIRFTRTLEDGATSLIEKPNHDCVFWDASAGCTVHPARPTQCRSWPFWRRNLASPAHWQAAARACPGMDQGPLHDAGWIERTSAQDGTSGVVPHVAELG